MDIGYNEPRRDLTANCEELRSRLNTTIRANSAATIETAISINFEVLENVVVMLCAYSRNELNIQRTKWTLGIMNLSGI